MRIVERLGKRAVLELDYLIRKATLDAGDPALFLEQATASLRQAVVNMVQAGAELPDIYKEVKEAAGTIRTASTDPQIGDFRTVGNGLLEFRLGKEAEKWVAELWVVPEIGAAKLASKFPVYDVSKWTNELNKYAAQWFVDTLGTEDDFIEIEPQIRALAHSVIMSGRDDIDGRLIYLEGPLAKSWIEKNSGVRDFDFLPHRDGYVGWGVYEGYSPDTIVAEVPDGMWGCVLSGMNEKEASTTIEKEANRILPRFLKKAGLRDEIKNFIEGFKGGVDQLVGALTIAFNMTSEMARKAVEDIQGGAYDKGVGGDHGHNRDSHTAPRKKLKWDAQGADTFVLNTVEHECRPRTQYFYDARIEGGSWTVRGGDSPENMKELESGTADTEEAAKEAVEKVIQDDAHHKDEEKDLSEEIHGKGKPVEEGAADIDPDSPPEKSWMDEGAGWPCPFCGDRSGCAGGCKEGATDSCMDIDAQPQVAGAKCSKCKHEMATEGYTVVCKDPYCECACFKEAMKVATDWGGHWGESKCPKCGDTVKGQADHSLHDVANPPSYSSTLGRERTNYAFKCVCGNEWASKDAAMDPDRYFNKQLNKYLSGLDNYRSCLNCSKSEEDIEEKDIFVNPFDRRGQDIYCRECAKQEDEGFWARDAVDEREREEEENG